MIAVANAQVNVEEKAAIEVFACAVLAVGFVVEYCSLVCTP